MSALETTRRTLLAGVAVVGTDLLPYARAQAMPATSVEHSDARLLALWEKWLVTLAAFHEALNVKDAALSERYKALRDLGWREWPKIDHPSYGDEIERVAVQRAAAQELLDVDIIRKGSEADEAEGATSTANRMVVDEIAATPARTLAGVAFKIEVSEDWLHEDNGMIDSIMADVAAFAAAYPTLSI